VLRILFFLALSFFFTSLAIGQANNVMVIPIKAIAGMQFDQVRFRVKPGAVVRIVLTNTDEMSHNLLITVPRSREAVVKEALNLGEKGPAMSYIPKSPNVLWAIPIVEPGQSKSITFTVPQALGVYPYVCTFPGHGYVMFGAMYVTDKPMPPLKDDPNIPEIRRESNATLNQSRDGQPWHPYKTEPPFLYRIFMPDAGPTAIAVNLPNRLSYCWDAGSCRLRYAWQGDFLDPIDYWEKKAEPTAKILGIVFYRDKTKFPLRNDDPEKVPTVDFKGYKLIQSYPEFHYTIDGVDVFELIKPKPDASGLERTFRIPDATKSVWFVFDKDDGVTYSSSVGKMADGTLLLSAGEAKQFTLMMTNAEGKKL
jgi:azurin